MFNSENFEICLRNILKNNKTIILFLFFAGKKSFLVVPATVPHPKEKKIDFVGTHQKHLYEVSIFSVSGHLLTIHLHARSFLVFEIKQSKMELITQIKDIFLKIYARLT
jgi:hypothetical protein